MKELFGKLNISLRTVAMAMILSLTFFLIGIERYKTYQSDVTIIVTLKSENAIRQQDQILNNVIQIPKLLSFYDRLLRDNPSIKDTTEGQKPDQRKTAWNETVTVKKLSDSSSTFSISILNNNESKANFMAQKTARTLFDVLSSYYNVKEDIDLRIVDGPITKAVVEGWQWILLISVILGSTISIVFGLLTVFRKKAAALQDLFIKNNPLVSLDRLKGEKSMPIEALENLYRQDQAESFVIQKQELKNEDKKVVGDDADRSKLPDEQIAHLQEIASRSVYPDFPEMPVHIESKSSSAPDNLPIADFADNSTFPEDQSPIKDEMIEEIESAVKEEQAKEKTHEPTPEELKKRLNQLLRGEM